MDCRDRRKVEAIGKCTYLDHVPDVYGKGFGLRPDGYPAAVTSLHLQASNFIGMQDRQQGEVGVHIHSQRFVRLRAWWVIVPPEQPRRLPQILLEIVCHIRHIQTLDDDLHQLASHPPHLRLVLLVCSAAAMNVQGTAVS